MRLVPRYSKFLTLPIYEAWTSCWSIHFFYYTNQQLRICGNLKFSALPVGLGLFICPILTQTKTLGRIKTIKTVACVLTNLFGGHRSRDWGFMILPPKVACREILMYKGHLPAVPVEIPQTLHALVVSIEQNTKNSTCSERGLSELSARNKRSSRLTTKTRREAINKLYDTANCLFYTARYSQRQSFFTNELANYLFYHSDE